MDEVEAAKQVAQEDRCPECSSEILWQDFEFDSGNVSYEGSCSQCDFTCALQYDLAGVTLRPRDVDAETGDLCALSDSGNDQMTNARCAHCDALAEIQ